MRRIGLAFVAAVAMVAAASTSHAATISLVASMDCAQANAGAGTCGAGGTGTGTASITLDDQTNLLSWNISWSGLSGTLTAAHFHGPALPSQNAGIQVSFLVIAPGNPSIGSTTITAAQAADLLNDLWYVNVHTTNFGGGEIRGQVTVVPPQGAQIPSLSGWSIALLIGALGGVGVLAGLRHFRR